MRKKLRIGLLALLLAGVAGRSMASGYVLDDFESYLFGTNLSALSVQGWGASAGVIVTSNVFDNTSQMAAFPPSTVASNTVNVSGGGGKLWTECRLDEAVRTVDPQDLPAVNSNMMVMVGMTTGGYAVVYNPAINGWDVCTNDAMGGNFVGLASGTWARVTLCQDFATHKVALFLNGCLLRQQVPFITNRTSYVGFSVTHGFSSDGYLDDVFVSNAIPPSLTSQTLSSTNDINGDGTADASEIMSFGALAKMVPLNYATITGALAAASAGDRIGVSNATYALPVTLSNGVTLFGVTLAANATNLTIQGNMTVGTGTVMVASGVFTVTGQVTVAAGGILTISNTVASFGGLATGAGGVVQVGAGSSLTVDGITHGSGTYWTVTNIVTHTGNGTITPSGTSTMLSTWSSVTYAMTGAEANVVGALTNNGVVTVYGTKTATYTNLSANITNNQVITAAFVYNGIRYVPGDHTTIAGALAAASADDRIVVGDGIYAESVVVSNALTLAGTNVTGLTGLTVASNKTVVLSGFTAFSVTNLVIQSGGTLQVSNSTLTANGMTLTGTFTLDSGWGGSLTPSSLNYTNDFESYATNMPLVLCGGQGWGASSAGSIVQGAVTNASPKAAKVASYSMLSNVVVSSTGLKVWTDLYLDDTTTRNPEMIPPATNTGRAVMLYVNTNDVVTLWNSNVWDQCAQDVAGNLVPTTSSGQWVRISLFEDFTAKTVALFIDGRLVRQGVPFCDLTLSSYQGLSVSAGDGSAYLDDVKIWTNIPTGLTNGPNSDLDNDGLPDALEIQLHGDTAVYPRGSVFKIR